MDLTVIAQSHSEDVDRRGPHLLEEKSPQIVEVRRLLDPEGLIPRQPVDKSQEEIETLNVLVNDGSRAGAYTLDLYAPPKLISEII